MQMTSGRAATLLVGFPFVLAAAGWGGFQAVGFLAQATEHHSASYAWNGGEISLSTSDGHLHVVAGDVSRVEVSYTERYGLKKPTVTETATPEGGVSLTAKCPNGVFSNLCSTSFDVTVPASARLQLHSGDGGITVSGITADVNADTGDGGISLDHVSGDVTLRTGDGGISLDHVSGDVTLHTGDGGIAGRRLASASVNASTGDGGIALTWSAAPTTVVVETGDGGIALELPSGSGPYDVSTHTGDGGRHVGVATDPSASAKITARTGDGGIAVEYAGAQG